MGAVLGRVSRGIAQVGASVKGLGEHGAMGLGLGRVKRVYFCPVSVKGRLEGKCVGLGVSRQVGKKGKFQVCGSRQ